MTTSLEEYLQELAGHSLGGNLQPPKPGDDLASMIAAAGTADMTDRGVETNPVPNFARAALILQGSSHVYSRKVEYLHGLVYKALNEFFQTAVANSQSSGGGGNGAGNARRTRPADPDIADFYDFDLGENFLLLDDVIPEDVSQDKINLREEDDDDEEEEESGGGRKSSPVGDRSMFSRSYASQRTRLSFGGMSVNDRSRLDRTSLGGGGAGGGRSGLTSAQQQRALLGILNNGTLRLDGNCDFGEDGVLLMPGTQSLQSATNPAVSSALFPMDGRSAAPAYDDDADGGRRSLFGGETDNNNAYNAVPDYGGDYSDGDDGPGFVMNDDDENENDKTVGQHGNASQNDPAPLEATLLRKRRVAFADAPSVDRPGKEERKKRSNDLWALMDPHSVPDSSYVPRPLRRGKTYRLPKGVTRPPSECVTGARTSHVSHPQRRSRAIPTARPSLAVEMFRVALGRQLALTSKVSPTGLAFGDEFIYIAKENARRRRTVAQTGAERKQRSGEVAGREGRRTATETDCDGIAAGGNRVDLDDDDGGGGFDFGGGEDNDDYDDEYDGGGATGGDSHFGNAGVGAFDDAFNRPQDGARSGKSPHLGGQSMGFRRTLFWLFILLLIVA